MRRTRLVASLAIASATSASLIAFAAPALAYPPEHCTATSASTFSGGASGTITGCGFDNGEQVDGYAHSARVFLGSTIASASGRATLHFTIPKSLDSGVHTLQLVGESSGHSVSEAIVVRAGGGTASAPTSSGSGLPFTGGNDIWPMTIAGVVLVGAGGALLTVRRRRSHPAAV
ncbi:MAG TPA: LPXTG cell wall anchor domain-containing protein [Mycobacteriales bacterium]|nr:LPXTG cell wall anchor domain-containing protein [Mycobacteriales bacterium]